MNRINLRIALWMSLAFAALLLAGCKQGASTPGTDKADPNLALMQAPAVGDLYAAELSAFSTAEFSEGGDAPSKAYGLMKVVAVDANKVVVITENAASDDQSISKQDILGDLSDITFDEEERIDIVRSQLVKAYETGKIYEVRR